MSPFLRALSAVFLFGAVLPTAAHADETNAAIVHRQALYKVAAGHMAGLKSILALKDGPAANAGYHAEGIVAAFQHFGDAYPAGSDKGETKAKANIWTEPAKFKEAGQKAYGAATNLVAAVRSDDKVKGLAAFKELGAACKACHDDFRKD